MGKQEKQEATAAVRRHCVLAAIVAATAPHPPLALRATGPLFLGCGVAIRVGSVGLAELRGSSAAAGPPSSARRTAKRTGRT